MMKKSLRDIAPVFKWLLPVILIGVAACSVNPATGDKQFTALMPAGQEASIGAGEHQKIIQAFGAPDPGDPMQAYVTEIGNKVAADTERADVQYKFFVLDSPIVNAFALPGGYVYVSRGLLAQANSEAEVASVLGHEIGHITARHSAERYSQSVVTSLGAVLLSSALDSKMATQAIGVGSNLFLASYSRGQEHQADELGVRYAHRAGYVPSSMADFLANLDGYTRLEDRLNGNSGNAAFSYFSTHPKTADRIGVAAQMAHSYPPNANEVGRDKYLRRIDGMVYGDSAKHGFTRGRSFYHPGMEFTFTAPQGFKIANQPEQVVATGPGGAVVIFDAVANKGTDALTYITKGWMRGEALQGAESTSVNGLNAATAAFPGTVGGKPVTVRLFVVEWSPQTFFRFQMAIPQKASPALVEDLKRTTYSLRRMSMDELARIKPYRLGVVTAGPNDTAASLAFRLPFDDLKEDRFRALNALKPSEVVVPGKLYKIVVE